MRYRISLIALVLGMGLLWPFPLAAALLMVPATFALVISAEEKLDAARPQASTNPLTPGSMPSIWKETQ